MGINHISEEVDEMDNELTQTELDKVLNLPSDEKAKYATLRGEGLRYTKADYGVLKATNVDETDVHFMRFVIAKSNLTIVTVSIDTTTEKATMKVEQQGEVDFRDFLENLELPGAMAA
jgi:hypothetical protein